MASQTITHPVGERPLLGDEYWDLRILRDATRYQHWVLASFGSALRGRILEVGAGNGNFTRWLAGKVTSVVALEPHADMRRELIDLRLEGVEALAEPLETFIAPDPAFDCVLMINVLEHIADDRGALEAARAALRPGGHACVLVPAHQRLFGSLDDKYGHLRRYSRRGLARFLEESGFAVDSCRYINPVGALGWLVATRFMRVRKLSRSSVTASEWIAVPVGRWLEGRGLRCPIGQSVIAVATRR